MRAEHRDLARSEVTARVVERIAARGEAAVSDALTDTLYHERLRLKGPTYAWEKKDAAWWKGISKQLAEGSSAAHRAMLREVVIRFVDEIMGHFDPRLYRMATGVLPTGLGLLLNSLNPIQALRDPKKALRFDDNIVIRGEIDAARRLAQKGTLVVVPTHLSNMDSIVMGYAAFLMGLPPLSYGAGLNLFTNRLIGFFMNNLGAYRVDRRKKAELYKDVLKEYATFSMELGYHNLFFPGGTRSRSGAIERKLKKGLLGSGLAAYQNNLRSGRKQANVYYVPCTLSYALVLEGQTLIEDYLKDVGKSRYIIEDDEFSRPRRVAQFMRDLMLLDSRIYLTVGEPLDPFGNRVDFQGRSVDSRGRPVDTARYVCRNGAVTIDPQRDHEYTNELSSAICRSFDRNNRVQCTHVVAFLIHVMMRRQHPGADVYRVLRDGLGPAGLPGEVVVNSLERLLVELRSRAASGALSLATEIEHKPASDVLDEALRYFSSYHRDRAVWRDGTRIQSESAELVYYYHNRLAGYGLEGVV